MECLRLSLLANTATANFMVNVFRGGQPCIELAAGDEWETKPQFDETQEWNAIQ
jgi:hypothetical protein